MLKQYNSVQIKQVSTVHVSQTCSEISFNFFLHKRYYGDSYTKSITCLEKIIKNEIYMYTFMYIIHIYIFMCLGHACDKKRAKYADAAK